MAAPAAHWLVCGLGNPGARYRETRHNVGFRVVARLARRLGVDPTGEVCRSKTARASLARIAPEREGDFLLAMPQTFMNRSGYAVRCLAERFELAPERILVVYDEIHLPLGRLRLRSQGSPGGHRGMESILENMGTDQVPRLRIGVGAADGPPAGTDLVDFVLAPFAPSELDAVEEAVARAADACWTWVRDGAEVAMRDFNG